jgi:hypothetical protein
MAKRIANHTGITTWTATNDTTNLVDSTYPVAFQGGSGTQRWNIVEVYLGGQAGASAPTNFCLAFDSQVATGSLTADASTSGANLTDVALDGSAGALSTAVKVFNKAVTNKPQRDTAKHLANLTFNAFGGIVRLNWPQDQQICGVGNTASFGEISLSVFAGGTAGAAGAHVIYEPF